MKYRKHLGFMFVAALVMAGLVLAATPQTIIVDGANDFLLDNLIEVDGGDTEFAEIDLDSIFVTNDTNKLYFGVGYSQGGWTTVQMGIHISTGDPGGTDDSWGRAIAWTNAPHKPDYQAYVNFDNNWQELRNWNDGTSSWDALYGGTASLGWTISTVFNELGLNLSDLGLAIGDTIYYEILITQDGSTKGPLDLMAGDADQLSAAGGPTTWDVPSPVELTSMQMYIIQSSADAIPPTVDAFYAEGKEGQASGDLDTDILEVRFSEPVDETTAETTTNYFLSGTSANITSAVRKVSFPDRVTLQLDASIAPAAVNYGVVVTNIEDLAGNPIVEDGVQNAGVFYYKGLMWKGMMGLHMRQHSVAPSVDTFTVEGSLAPLTFGLCDNMFLADNSDSIYVGYASFSLLGEDVASVFVIQEETLEWKFAHQCAEYEPLAANRIHLMTDDQAWDTLEYWWNDEDAGSFTAGPIDVIFTVDANTYGATVDSIMAINGSALPLTFTIPSVNTMADDGIYPDVTAADGVYALVVRFTALSPKNVEYKYVYNDVYECVTEANRDVWLNDAAFDTIGGAFGPIVMPLQYYDRCSTVGHAVEVVFKVDTRWVKPTVLDTIAVNGNENNQLPLLISWAIPSINPMVDDGTGPDDTAGDGIYATSIVFPDSSGKFIEYKYLMNSTYECSTQTNRSFYLDETYDDQGSPQILDLAYFNTCWIDVTEEIPTIPFALKQNFPNPFNPVTTITFSVPQRGRAVLSVYNVKGELVQTLIDDVVAAGEVSVTWDATDMHGRQISSGVYFYRLRVGDLEMSRKMILLR